jgi:hypothetical protein
MARAPDAAPFPKVQLSLGTGGTIRITGGKPGLGRPEENRKRKQEGKNSKLYRAGLMWISSAWSTAEEINDLYEAIFYNIYQGDRNVRPRLTDSGFIDPLHAIELTNAVVQGRLEMDWKGVVIDYGFNRAMDIMIGKTMRGTMNELAQHGWTRPVGPTAGIGI